MKRKTALITGVTGGIGSVVAKSFITAGYFIVGSGRNFEPPASLVGNIDFVYHSADLREKSGVESLFAILQQSDELKIVIHCAGILVLKDLAGTSEKEWQDTIRTNLDSSFYIAQASAKKFKEQKNDGVVVIIGSRWGKGTEKAPAYAASKAGLRGLVASLQKENLRTGIRFVLVSPGSVFTEMSKSVANISNENILRPEDIADCLLYIASTPSNVIFDEIIVKAYPYDYDH